jgi:hypothetical protein
MSTQVYEEGLVRIYTDQVAALSVQALDGADVKHKVAEVVETAAKHFAVVKSSTEIGNLKWFVGQLRLRAELTHESQPQCRETFRDASQLAAAVLKQKTA